jgi:RNA polymerase sigma-70 factor (ECF subfamily)
LISQVTTLFKDGEIRILISFVSLKILSDIEVTNLTERLQAGDQLAMSTLYDSYGNALYGLIFKIVGDEDVAQDVLQDSFVKIWKKAPSFSREKGSLFTWMLNVSRNTAIDALRKVNKERDYKIQMSTDSVYTLNDSALNVNKIGLDGLIEKLPQEHQLMIEYLYFKGYTQQEVADELDIPLGTVKTRARNAVLELKKYFSITVLFWILKNI